MRIVAEDPAAGWLPSTGTVTDFVIGAGVRVDTGFRAGAEVSADYDEGLRVERFRFPQLRALNFVVHGLLQEGVAASTRQDAQAKAVGEWLRSRVVDVPTALLGTT